MTKGLLAVSLFLMCAVTAAAQDPILPPVLPVIRGGILNGKAVSLPKPEYPESARAAHIGGRVAVDVTVDEQGLVTSAVAAPNDERTTFNANGEREPPMPVDASLREAAERAALMARFSPTFLNGVLVKVTGRIVYNFVADNSDKPARVGEVFGPSLNSRAIELPDPGYPLAARAVGASGSVTVHVVLAPDGSVISAQALSGHPLLRSAAVEAVKGARFKPAVLGTTPTRDEGVVIYVFKKQ